MRILLLSLGTRGDIQPFVALGRRLRDTGHDVSVCASASFAPWIQGHGLGYAPMNDDIIELVNSDAGRRALEGSGGVLARAGRMVEASRRYKVIFRRALAEQWEAAQGAQAIVYHPNAVGGFHLAEALGVPGIMADPLPTWVPTRSFPHIVAPDLGLGGGYNRLTHLLLMLVPRLLFGSVVSQWRRETLRLPPRSFSASELVRADGRPVPVLLCFSRHLVPPPPDWPESVRVTGYWFLDEGQTWQPPLRLVEFLDDGPPPVVIGFGSMSGRDPGHTARVVLEALARSGQRGLIVTGWGGLSVSDPPREVHVTGFAPYDWLLPRVAAVVHHGGAGTTAAGLRAGKPTVICPFVADQPFWGRRVGVLGVGPPPIPQRKLTAGRLAAAIQQAVTDAQMQRRAAELGARIRSEHGVANAVECIERHLGAMPPGNDSVSDAGLFG
jgi:sterol 3beta-glucosyltransferase